MKVVYNIALIAFIYAMIAVLGGLFIWGSPGLVVSGLFISLITFPALSELSDDK